MGAESDDAMKKEILELERSRIRLSSKPTPTSSTASVQTASLGRAQLAPPLPNRSFWPICGQEERNYNAVAYDDLQVPVYGDTVVVTGHSTTNPQYDRKAFISPRRFVNV